MAIPRLKIVNLEQGSDAWLAWRNTVIGASDGLRAMNMSKALWMVKAGLKDAPNFANAAMDRGNKLEDEARQSFVMEHMADIEPICGQRGFIASSGDGIDRKAKIGLEIKCPSKPEIHLGHVRGNIEPEYYHQMQQTMYVFGLRMMFFVSYMPEHNTPYDEQVVNRDNKYIDTMVKRLTKFWERVESRAWVDDTESISKAVATVAVDGAAPAIVSDIGIKKSMQDNVNSMIAAADAIELKDEDSASNAADILSGLNGLVKKADEARTDIVKPHNDFVSGVNAKFKPLTDAVKKSVLGLKSKAGKYLEGQTVKSIKGEVGSITTRVAKSFEVIDEDKVPKEMFKTVIDDKKVTALLKAGIAIKGIKAVDKITLVCK